MDIDIIREFLTLSEVLNFSETAKRHYVTQPVLSKHIRTLEAELGVNLFNRTHQSVELTRLGKQFAPEARKMVEIWDRSVDELRNSAKEYDSRFSVMYLDAAARDWLPLRLRDFMRFFPSVMVEIRNADIPPIMQSLNDGTCDMALTIYPPIHKDPGYDSFHLYRDPLCVALSKSHPLAGKDRLTFDMIRDEVFIAASPNLVTEYQQFIEMILKENGIRNYHRIAVETVEQGFMMMESGGGIAIVPEHQKYFGSPNTRIIPLEDGRYSVDVALMWKRTNNNPNINRFLQIVNGSAESDG